MSDQPWPPPLVWPEDPLTDGVVLLDRMTEDDVDRVVVGCTDPDTQRWLPLPSPYGEVEALTFIRSRETAAGSGDELTFAVRGSDDRILAGAIGLGLRGRRHEGEIGYWTAPDRRGRGWTVRSLRLVARYALMTLPLRRVEIIADIRNIHSRRVAAAAGATFEGVRRNGLPTSDRDDAAIYSFIPGDESLDA